MKKNTKLRSTKILHRSHVHRSANAVCGVLIQTAQISLQFSIYMHTFRLAKLQIRSHAILSLSPIGVTCKYVLCSWASASASADRLSISIGVTASNCHANALQSFRFIRSFDLYFQIIFASILSNVNFLNRYISLFQTWPIRDSCLIFILFVCFFSKIMNIHPMFFLLKSSESKRFGEWKDRNHWYWPPEQFVNDWHITAKLCPPAIR